MADNRRMVSCISGNIQHLFFVSPGSAADADCGGQHISQEQCPECVYERREYLRRQSQYCECQFTPDAELCQDRCSYLKEARDTPDAPVGLEIYMHDTN